MSTYTQRREHLNRILAAEGLKTGAYATPGPAIFREMCLDTHDIRPITDFRPTTGSARTRHQNGSKTVPKPREGYSRPARLMSASNQGNVRSVFRPSAEQLAATKGSVQRRQNMSTSEWALLDTFEVQMFDQERKQQLLNKREAAVQQRLALDRQMVVQRAKLAAEEQEKREDSEVIMLSVLQYKESERLRAEAVRAISRAIKVDQDAELAKAILAKEQALRMKREEELQLLAEGEVAMEAERQLKANKAEAAKELWQATMRGNEARIIAKKQAELAQRQKDDELMQESIRTVEAQMVEREEKAKAFHAMIAARSSRAGVQVVEESRGRLEREQRLIAQYDADRERAAVAHEIAGMARKKAANDALRFECDAHQAVKLGKAAAAAAEVKAARLEAITNATAEAAGQELKIAGIRAKTAIHASQVVGQIRQKAQRAMSANVFMTPEEKKLNRIALEHAIVAVGVPRQLTVRLY